MGEIFSVWWTGILLPAKRLATTFGTTTVHPLTLWDAANAAIPFCPSVWAPFRCGLCSAVKDAGPVGLSPLGPRASEWQCWISNPRCLPVQGLPSPQLSIIPGDGHSVRTCSRAAQAGRTHPAFCSSWLGADLSQSQSGSAGLMPTSHLDSGSGARRTRGFNGLFGAREGPTDAMSLTPALP